MLPGQTVLGSLAHIRSVRPLEVRLKDNLGDQEDNWKEPRGKKDTIVDQVNNPGDPKSRRHSQRRIPEVNLTDLTPLHPAVGC